MKNLRFRLCQQGLLAQCIVHFTAMYKNHNIPCIYAIGRAVYVHIPYFITKLRTWLPVTRKKRNFGVKQLILQNVEFGNEQKEKGYYTLRSLSTTIFMEARNLHVTRIFNGKCMGARRIFISIRGVYLVWYSGGYIKLRKKAVWPHETIYAGTYNCLIDRWLMCAL